LRAAFFFRMCPMATPLPSRRRNPRRNTLGDCGAECHARARIAAPRLHACGTIRQSSRHQAYRNAEPVRLMKTCARAATRDHHTVLRIYFFSRHFLPNSLNRVCCRHETAADHRARSWCHPGTADTLANHTRVLVCTQRSPPSGPREGFAPRFLRAVFMAWLRVRRLRKRLPDRDATR
jgi:hypothetical protein